MNTTPFIVLAFLAGAGAMWLTYDQDQIDRQQAAHYNHMACLFEADTRRGLQPEQARGWPNYKNIEVECE